MLEASQLAPASATGRQLAVEARNLSVSYDRHREKDTLVVFHDFSLDVAKGEFLAIVGPQRLRQEHISQCRCWPHLSGGWV